MIEDDFVYDNEEESEMAQLHAIHLHLNAVAEVRRHLMALGQRPSLTHCESCGEPIPARRQQLLPGVSLCVDCKSLEERQKNF
jgi:phage/conjugal plasmid C-4 type zinc finger TraR family protein